jgi:hypothetical protein
MSAGALTGREGAAREIAPPTSRPVSLRSLALGAAGTAVAIALLYFVDPATTRMFPTCPFHELTGLHCPGCGATRAMHQLLHGHFATAFDYNPLVVTLLPFAAWAVAAQALRAARGLPTKAVLRKDSGWTWTLLVLALAFCVARNLPWAPLRWMAP